MEEAEEQVDNNINVQARKISIEAGEITRKFKSFKDRQMFCKEMSKIKFIYFRFILPEGTWFR